MSTQREADEATISRHIDNIGEALGNKDLDALSRLYTPDVVSFDVEPPLQHVGVEAKLSNWKKVFMIFREVNYEFRDLAVTVGGDVAFGHGFGRLSGTLGDGTATSGMWVRVTFGLVRAGDGGWLIAHDQVSVPFDMRTRAAVTDLSP